MSKQKSWMCTSTRQTSKMKELFKNLFKEKDLQVRVKKVHPNAVIPAYAKAGDAGMDLTAVSRSIDADGNVVYGTGLAFEIPEGHVGLIYPRSSTAKKNITLTNAVGVVDSVIVEKSC